MGAEWTRRKAKFGKYMKELREQVEPRMLAEDAAVLVRAARPTITRMENGTTLPNYHFMLALIDHYAASPEQRARAEQLWEIAKQPVTRIEHAADMPSKYVIFRREESTAVRERRIDYVVVPGLLQTAGYAAAVAEAAREFNTGRPPGWDTRAVAERQTRQQLLTKPTPLHLHAVIDEGALRRSVGGPEVMRDQLRRLIEVGKQDNVTIQVVPLDAGAFGTMSGPAAILDFGEDEPSNVYLEYAAGGEVLDTETDVAAFVQNFERVSREIALPPDVSAELIKAVLDQLEEQ